MSVTFSPLLYNSMRISLLQYPVYSFMIAAIVSPLLLYNIERKNVALLGQQKRASKLTLSGSEIFWKLARPFRS